MILIKNSIQYRTNNINSEELSKLELEELENLNGGLKTPDVRRDCLESQQRYGDIIIDGAALDMD